MALVLDTFFSDFRLYNLFDNNSYSVTQIWIFEINRSGNKDHRFIYGRTLPNTYKSDEWQIKSSQKTELYKNCTIKIITLTLYTSGDKIKKFFEAFINGISISEASHLAEIILTEKNTSIGSVIFGANPTMRPVMHFPTRDYFSVKTNRLSPSSDASADSGAIFSDDKQNIFSIPEGLDQKIADVVCSELNTQTGLDFKNLDSWRLGDFELICLPGLNRFERKKFDIELKNNISLKIFEPLTYKETDLTVVFNTYSDDVIKASYIKNFSKNTPYPLSHTFTTEDNKIDATAFTMEIYATCDTNNETYLQLQIGNHFIRSVNLSMHFSSSIHSPITMGWLEKQVPVRDKAKVEAASHITRAINSS
ncbi:VPA1262 family N-terminal domain-containing protein, partial [Acinetobacter sp. ANC 4639]